MSYSVREAIYGNFSYELKELGLNIYDDDLEEYDEIMSNEIYEVEEKYAFQVLLDYIFFGLKDSNEFNILKSILLDKLKYKELKIKKKIKYKIKKDEKRYIYDIYIKCEDEDKYDMKCLEEVICSKKVKIRVYIPYTNESDFETMQDAFYIYLQLRLKKYEEAKKQKEYEKNKEKEERIEFNPNDPRCYPEPIGVIKLG